MARTESPESMLIFSGLFTLAAALRRHVKFPMKYLGTYDIYPSLFVTFIAPPGVAKKSTTSGLAEELLSFLPLLRECDSNITVAALIDTLAQKDQEASLYMISSELATTINLSGNSFYDTLTDLFDGKKKITHTTIIRGKTLAENPCLNFICATTPDSITSGVIPIHQLSSGYGSRTIFIYETEPRQRKLFYYDFDKNEAENIDKKSLELKEDLIADLQHIADEVYGTFRIEKDVAEYLEKFYQATPYTHDGEYRKISGYFSRKHVHIIKLAMLLHIAYSDDLVVTMEDATTAVAMLENLEPKMLAAFRSIGKNIYTVDMVGIGKYIAQHKKVPKSQILREFMAAAEPFKLEQILLGLVQMKQIEARFNDDASDIVYSIVEVKV